MLHHRRKQREAKRFSKQVQAERKKEKSQEKKASIANISKLRKQRARDGFAGELDMDRVLGSPAGQPPMAPGQRIRPGTALCILGTLTWCPASLGMASYLLAACATLRY